MRRLVLLTVLVPLAAPATSYLGSPSLSYPNSPKVPIPGKSCPAPLNQNFCAADVDQRDGFDAEVHGFLRKQRGASCTGGQKVTGIATDGSLLCDADIDTVYVHPATHAPSVIAQDASNRFVSDAEKTTWNAKASPTASYVTTSSEPGLANSHAVVTTGAAGCLQWTGTAFTNLAVATDARVAALEAAVQALSGGTNPGTPTCVSCTPSSGYPGQTTTCSGTKLTAPTSVKFNGTSATTYTASGDGTSINATVPVGANTGTVAIAAAGGTATCPSFTVSATPTATALFGTAHAPTNLPISYWEASIKSHYGVTSVVDTAATADLQGCLAGSYGSNCGINWKAAESYTVFGEVAYAIYFVNDADASSYTEVPMYAATSTGAASSAVRTGVNSDGSWKTCNLDLGQTWAGKIRMPNNAKRWDSNPASPTHDSAVPINPGSVGSTDIHFTVVDAARNRMYSFYSYGGEVMGVFDGKFAASSMACDLYRGIDADVTKYIAADIRYACPGGYLYGDPRFPALATDGPGCGLDGLGAGVAAGGGSGLGDSLGGYMGGFGIILPQDFDDTGWGCPTSDACGTLHHQIRFSLPAEAQSGYMWPAHGFTGTTSRALRIGQIMRLSPSYDCVANTGGASPTTAQLASRRVCKTLQVYGAAQSDYSNYGPAFFALGGWAGTGPTPSAYDPWTSSGGANDEAAAFAAGRGANGVKALPIPVNAWGSMEMVLPHGASYAVAP